MARPVSRPPAAYRHGRGGLLAARTAAGHREQPAPNPPPKRCGCVLRLFRTSYILKPTQNFRRVAVNMLEHMLSHKSRGLVSGANKAASTT